MGLSLAEWTALYPDRAAEHPDHPSNRTAILPRNTDASPGPWVVVLDGWTPPTVNALMRGHWRTRARVKKAAVNRVVLAVRQSGVPAATGKRRVEIAVEYPNRGHVSDPDNVPKAILDGLKTAAALIDDTSQWCECPTPTVGKGPAKRTTLVIRDVDAA